jgi:hypothetical protein
MSLCAGDYRPRDAEHAVLYRVIDEHLAAFLETIRGHADGAVLPAFVEQELRDFLTWRPAHDRVRRPPGRRGATAAARAPVGFDVPCRLRYLPAWDYVLARAVLAVYMRVLFGFQRNRARRYGHLRRGLRVLRMSRRRTHTKSNDDSRSLMNHRTSLLHVHHIRTWRPDDRSVIEWPHRPLDLAGRASRM